MKVHSLQMQQTSKHTTAYSAMHRSWSPSSCLEALTMPLLYLHVFELRTSGYWYVICSYLKACKCCKNWIQQRNNGDAHQYGNVRIRGMVLIYITWKCLWHCLNFTSNRNSCNIYWSLREKRHTCFLESHLLIGEREKRCQADGGRCGIWKQSSSPPVPGQYFLNRTTFGKTQCVSSAYWIK